MTDRPTTPAPGEGERLHAQRRRHFWILVAGLAAIGMVAGFVWGLLRGYLDGSDQAMPAYLGTLAAVGVIIFGIAAAYGSWRFFVSVDEVEVADNLWGSLIGFYAYAILFPCWWALWRLDRAPEPNDWIIFGVSLGTAALAYFVRKIAAR